jgi:hypothetical protein
VGDKPTVCDQCRNPFETCECIVAPLWVVLSRILENKSAPQQLTIIDDRGVQNIILD